MEQNVLNHLTINDLFNMIEIKAAYTVVLAMIWQTEAAETLLPSAVFHGYFTNFFDKTIAFG